VDAIWKGQIVSIYTQTVLLFLTNFENVLLLVRDIANPSEEDVSFPLFRHKDWYQGSSWASGVPYPAFLNGKNQESSSEAIAAYEGVALFGQVMNEIWEEKQHKRYAAVSKQIANVGKLMAGTELVSAKRYWHVKDKDDPQRIYPKQFSKNVIGILWQTMAQFGTWFGAAAYLPIGIQLLPLTPISEDRDDDLDWINLIYKPLTYGTFSNVIFE
jgi:endo-1,3(4)-beta-glucanase